MSAAPGWFPDPLGRHEHRWFNGTTWTSDVADGGVRYVDPLGSAPTPRSDATRNGLATAAMVCGILAVLIAWVPFVVVGGIVLAILAVALGVAGMRRAGPDGEGRGRAVAGVVTGSVGVALSIVGIVFTVVLWRAIVDFLEPEPNRATVLACDLDGRTATVRGDLTNRGDVAADFTVFVTVDGNDGFATLDDVPPGTTVRWEAEVRRVERDAPCDPSVVVRGPFPLGIELDESGR